MSQYITIRLTLSQAEAAENATDLIADSYDADGNKREARRYSNTSKRITEALQQYARANARRLP